MRILGTAGKTICLTALMLLTLTLLSVLASDYPYETIPLTEVERQWLRDHPAITLAPDPEKGPQWHPSKTFIFASASSVLGGLLLLSFYWNLSLRNMVQKRTISLEEELKQRQKAEEGLKTLTGQLENLVRERTAELESEVSERIKSEQAAISSENRFKELFQNVADPIYIADTTGRIVAANDQACRELHYPLAEMFELHLRDLDASVEAVEVFQSNIGHLENNSCTTFESCHRRKDGSIFPVELNVCLIDLSGEQMVMGVARNITNRKRMEDCLAFLAQTATIPSGENFFQRLARYLAVTLDMDFICIDVLEPGDLSARTVAVYFDGQFEDNVSYTLKDTPCGEVVDKKVCCYLEGVRHHFPSDAVLQDMQAESYAGTILWGSHGNQIGLIAAIGRNPLANQELTQEILRMVSGRAAAELERTIYEEERLHLEQQLLHAQKLESLGILAGGIAHDFNNILASIVGNTDLALRRLSPESPVVDNLKRIEHAAGRATDLAMQMLAYSGKGKFVIEALDLNHLVEEMGYMLEVSISKKAALRYDLDPNLPLIDADATQIRQIVMNLVINASEAIGDHSGVIAISTGRSYSDSKHLKNDVLKSDIAEGLYVYLEVSDTGCGMDHKTQSRIFDPFFTTKFTGRGLGMAAVQGIVRGHRGAIDVVSEKGKGSRFKILLPAGSNATERASVEGNRKGFYGEGTVLLVDDEETVQDMGREMLKELGFSVLSARDGREAVTMFKAHRDLFCVVLDLTMPNMDGEQTFRQLQEIDPKVRVIMSSGYNEGEVTQKFAGKELAGFIQKPYKLSGLEDALRKV